MSHLDLHHNRKKGLAENGGNEIIIVLGVIVTGLSVTAVALIILRRFIPPPAAEDQQLQSVIIEDFTSITISDRVPPQLDSTHRFLETEL